MAADIFVKIGDIKGESSDAKHPAEIEVLSFSWGVASSSAPDAGGRAGKPDFRDLSFVHFVDRASPKLLEACATGMHMKEATLTHRKAGNEQHEYLIVKMSDVTITAVAHGGGSGQPSPETVSLAFAKVDFQYRPQKPDGSLDAAVQFKYDIRANKPG